MRRRGTQFRLININDAHMRWINVFEGDDLVSSGQAIRLFKPRQHGKPRELAGYRLCSPVNTPRPDACSITAREIQVNAFAKMRIGNHSRTAGLLESQRKSNINPTTGRVEAEDNIERTEGKVTLWPLSADTKAPLVTRRPDLEAVRLAADIERARLSS